MIVLVTSTWPLTKNTEVTDTFLKVATSPPPYIKSLGNYMVMSRAVKESTNINIVEIDDEHIVEGLAELTRRSMPFFSIEGFGTTTEIIMPLRAAMELTGQ
jgi:hypothetical protein